MSLLVWTVTTFLFGLVSVAVLNSAAIIDTSAELLERGEAVVHSLIGEPTNTTSPSPLSKTKKTIVSRAGVAARQNMSAGYVLPPVILFPGIITSKLEVWESRPCLKGSFRTVLWGGTSIKFLSDIQCWMRHVMLDPATGLDPEGVRVRVVEGMAAVDFLMGLYWVWSPMIESLADIGYDTNSMASMAYDWRLSFHNLEERDGYFTSVKEKVESMVRRRGKRATLIAHSMGCLVSFYFLNWARAQPGVGQRWIDANVGNVVNIGAPWLGVPKTVSSLISGEMKDTADLSPALRFFQQKLLSSHDLLRLLRSFGSLPSMWPKGGRAVWGAEPVLDLLAPLKKANATASCNAAEDAVEHGVGALDSHASPIPGITSPRGFDVDEAYDLLLRRVAPNYTERWADRYSRGPRLPPRGPASYANPLESPLPGHKDMTVYNLHGHDLPTEVGYLYRPHTGANCMDIPITVASDVTDEAQSVKSGVRFSAGDGTVPLVSLGLVSHLWAHSLRHNPGRARIVVREYSHRTSSVFEEIRTQTLLRGGLASADHVDLMGNHQLIGDILSIVMDRRLDDQIHSNITAIAREIQRRL